MWTAMLQQDSKNNYNIPEIEKLNLCMDCVNFE